MINPNNLDLQKDRIFLNPETKEMKCIYWPVVNNQNEVPVQAFFQQLPVGVTFDTFEDTAYLYEYSNFFNKVAPFSLQEFEQLILKFQDIPYGYTPYVSKDEKYLDEIQEYIGYNIEEININKEEIKIFCIGPDTMIATDYKLFDYQHANKTKEYFEFFSRVIHRYLILNQ